MNHPKSRHTDTAAEAEKTETEKVRGNALLLFRITKRYTRYMYNDDPLYGNEAHTHIPTLRRDCGSHTRTTHAHARSRVTKVQRDQLQGQQQREHYGSTAAEQKGSSCRGAEEHTAAKGTAADSWNVPAKNPATENPATVNASVNGEQKV